MPLPLIAHVPSTARSLFSLDELEVTPPPSREQPTISKYTLVEHLGSGCSGSNVFAATCGSSREVFAVKVLRGGNAVTACGLPRFMREAEITCELGCPHLASGVEWGADGEDHYLVMKLLRGKSLEEVLQDAGRLEWKTATQLMLDVSRDDHNPSKCCHEIRMYMAGEIGSSRLGSTPDAGGACAGLPLVTWHRAPRCQASEHYGHESGRTQRRRRPGAQQQQRSSSTECDERHRCRITRGGREWCRGGKCSRRGLLRAVGGSDRPRPCASGL